MRRERSDPLRLPRSTPLPNLPALSKRPAANFSGTETKTMSHAKLSMCVAALATALLLTPFAGLAADAAAGKVAFDTNCALCHGEKGDAKTPMGEALQPPPRDFTKAEFKFDTDGDGEAGTDADLKNVISSGAAEYGGNPLMAAWGAMLSDNDVVNVIAHIRSLKQ